MRFFSLISFHFTLRKLFIMGSSVTYIFLYRKSNAFFSFYRKTNAFFFSLPKFTQKRQKPWHFFPKNGGKKARFDKPPALLKLLYFLPLITGHCIVFTSAISTLGYIYISFRINKGPILDHSLHFHFHFHFTTSRWERLGCTGCPH